jgi:hypothetical protein
MPNWQRCGQITQQPSLGFDDLMLARAEPSNDQVSRRAQN